MRKYKARKSPVCSYLSEMLQPQCSAALDLSPPCFALKALVPTSTPSASCPGHLCIPLICLLHTILNHQRHQLSQLPLLFPHCFVKLLFSDCEPTSTAVLRFALFQTAATPHCFQKTPYYFIPSNCLGKCSPPMMHLSLPFHFIILNTSWPAELAML